MLDIRFVPKRRTGRAFCHYQYVSTIEQGRGRRFGQSRRQAGGEGKLVCTFCTFHLYHFLIISILTHLI